MEWLSIVLFAAATAFGVAIGVPIALCHLFLFRRHHQHAPKEYCVINMLVPDNRNNHIAEATSKTSMYYPNFGNKPHTPMT